MLLFLPTHREAGCDGSAVGYRFRRHQWYRATYLATLMLPAGVYLVRSGAQPVRLLME